MHKGKVTGPLLVLFYYNYIIIPDSCTAFKWTSTQLSYILSLLLYVLLEP